MIPVFTKSRAIRASADRVSRSYRETIDGRAWEILPEERLCRCVVQGSEDKIPVHYPHDMRSAPSWLKKGAAVRIHFIGGCRHRAVLAGQGLVIPTPEAGAAADPTMAVGQNCVISGCVMRPAGGMHVYFELGRIRINDVYYDLTDNWTMGDTPNLTMGDASTMTMGNIAEVIQVSAADSTRFRQDAFVAGADGIIDYLVGTPDATNPQLPATPSAHVQLRTLLVPPGITEITGDLVDQTFVEPFPAAFDLTVANDQLAWAESSTTITVQVLDQYNRPNSGSWTIDAVISAGTGSINSAVSTNGGSTAVFTYHRESPQGDGYEECPVFIDFTLRQDKSVTNSAAILLEDELGGIII